MADYEAEEFDAEAAMKAIKRRVVKLVDVDAAGLPERLRSFRASESEGSTPTRSAPV